MKPRKKVLDLLQLELQVDISCLVGVLGIGLQSCERAVLVLIH